MGHSLRGAGHGPRHHPLDESMGSKAATYHARGVYFMRLACRSPPAGCSARLLDGAVAGGLRLSS